MAKADISSSGTLPTVCYFFLSPTWHTCPVLVLLLDHCSSYILLSPFWASVWQQSGAKHHTHTRIYLENLLHPIVFGKHALNAGAELAPFHTPANSPSCNSLFIPYFYLAVTVLSWSRCATDVFLVCLLLSLHLYGLHSVLSVSIYYFPLYCYNEMP